MNQVILASAIFLLTYALIISEKLHRTVVALVGGILMLLTGIISQEAALHHIDFNTLGLLTGMMVIVGITRQTGIFQFIAIKAAKWAEGEPLRLLVALAVITALASALLDNVTTVLLIVPVTFSITSELKINPMPFLITEILASNIGGTATLIGDPPNIMIGSAVKGLSFNDFVLNLAPPVIITFILTILILRIVYRKQLVVDEQQKQKILGFDEYAEIKDITLLKKSLVVLALTILGFVLHQALHLESATVALGGATLLLLLSKHDPEHALREVEWPTIFFFIGLFILVGGLVEVKIIDTLAQKSLEVTKGSIALTSMLVLWVAAVASAFVDNIPFVATMIPMIKTMGQLGGIENLNPIWWSLSLGACLGGNGTLVGASANVIVAGLAHRQGHPIGFLKYMLIGLPLMFLSIIVSTAYVYLRYLL